MSTNVPTRPVFVTDAHLQYLNDLRESGATNMWGASPYLEWKFPSLTSAQANETLCYWIGLRQAQAEQRQQAATSG